MQKISTRTRAQTKCPPDRDGSTLLIVIVLLGMLSLVGFLFYTFAASERSAATYFADANKYFTPDFDADTLVEFGLQQLIVGPDISQTQSALYGGRHSMIPNIFGRDLYTYNGAGINLSSVDFNPYPAAPNAATDGNAPFVDMNRDGVPDVDVATDPNTPTPLGQAPLDFNDSAQAHGGLYPRNLFNDAANPNITQVMPDPGVDYTYPDINNLFLAYKGYAIDPNGNTVQVIIPSFHRPQLLRQPSGPADQGKPVADWYQNPNYAGRILRPHPAHLNPNGSPRFPTTPIGTLTSVFPFRQGSSGYQGVWSRTFRGDTGNYAHEYDADNDGDGTNEGIFLDLGHPVQTSADGRRYVPLYSFTAYDADGLFNINVHGNHAHLAQLTQLRDFSTFSGTALPVNYSGTTRYVHGSNQGVTPFEVNPQVALSTDPVDTSTFAAPLDASYTNQFGISPATVTQAANMDWYRILAGTATMTSPTVFSDLHPGRWGDANTWLYGAFMQGVTASSAISAAPVNQMPKPGETQIDDNWNRYEGQFAWSTNSSTPGFTRSGFLMTYTPPEDAGQADTPQYYPAMLQFYANNPYGNPLDFNANGTIVAASTAGKQRRYQQYGPLYNPMRHHLFVEYDNAGAIAATFPYGTWDSTNLNSVEAGMRPDSVSGAQMVDRNLNPLLPGTPPDTHIDEAQEFIAEPDKASKYDGLFRDDDMAALQLSQNDKQNLSLSSRLEVLGPLNFRQANRAREISHRFTTSSNDRKQYGLASLASDTAYKSFLPLPDTMRAAAIDNIYGDAVVYRPWELSDLDGDFKRETFPPVFYHLDTATPAQTVYVNSLNFDLSESIRAFDPLRGPVRKLLQSTYENRTPNGDRQLRLSLNHLTTTDSNPRSDFRGNIIQRELTPHYAELTNAPVVPNPAINAASQEFHARLDRQQMARDIYVMLYLLGGGLDYATQDGHIGPISQFTPATDHPNIGYLGSNAPDGSGNRNLYSDRQLREMAQFAVNVVDALDPDHIMTKFEYDKNLGNGWGIFDGDVGTSILLDDNPYTDDSFVRYTSGSPKFDPNYPEDSDERGVVYGVEVQEMTFSEVLAFQCPRMHFPSGSPYDHTATEHNETEVRYHTYLELRNISPKTINFGTTNCWRIRSVSRNTSLVPQVYGPQRYVKFTQGTVDPSSIFTVGNAGEMDAALVGPDHSRFRCANTNSAGNNVDASDPQCWIAPKTVNALDLDLVANRDNTGAYQFQLIDPGATFTDLYNVADDTDITNTAAGTDGVGRFFNDTSLHDPTYVSDTTAQQDAKDNSIQQPMFILERRQYPDREEPAFNNQAQNDDNPWVPVDQVTVAQFRRFGLLPTDNTQGQFDTVLRQLLSRERAQPLSAAEQDYDLPAASPTPPTPPSDVKANSLMLENSRTDTATAFADWQMPFDRPFASPGELLQIPLYGPQYKTKWLFNSTESPKTQGDAAETAYNAMIPPIAYAVGQQIGIPTAFSAAGKFLMPQHVSNINLAPGTKVPVHDNRWYRFFEFFEVPTRMHRQLGNPLDNVRIPGKMNLNGFRYTDVLAGLIDDQDVMFLDPTSLATTRPTLYALDAGDTDTLMPLGRRDWWVQFLKARDGRRTTVAGDDDVNGNPIVRMNPDNVTGLYLPGLADSSPFRSFASLGFTKTATFEAPETALDQTLFRRLPLDMANQTAGGDPDTDPTFNTRHLWEVGKADDHTGQGSPDPIDAGMRDRLLAKIFNNTTTRSHVFYVFVSVQFFEADDTTFTAADPRNVIIGGPLQAEPEYRGFFVIDRSKPEDAYDGVSGRFTNYRSMIKYRLRIE